MKKSGAGTQAYALFASATGSSSKGVLSTIARHLTGCFAPNKTALHSATAVSYELLPGNYSVAASVHGLSVDHRQPALTRLSNVLFNQALALDLERFDEGAPADEMFRPSLKREGAHPRLADSLGGEQLAVQTMEKGLKRLAEDPAQSFARCHSFFYPISSDTTSPQASLHSVASSSG
ncbi:Type III effector HopS2 [Pseudomonas syringae pv. coriandricola]|uniref:Type III effector HopS2 n=2 Tax=Pseudomonas syringae group genomosp. 3 TaxID=251701 RepID=Q87WG2_PSESM|nr:MULTISPECIES: type III effector [Pseudomonas syringae group]RMR27959.1 Type III effector HopS2 [Pseudomonas syringae pv. coriandricola]AAO58034.1 type III effector HopS2 [Pseudomonas syringae pv. tomato str. DC3000]MBW8019948.1 type III effector [Pseudomonas syringae pv. tomato]PYD05697.1 type III effector [Pseudomonas syringae pv. maculicola]RMU07413.1 Type III effector HopS2 [Pseudomonas syringae pv. coriandricola]